ncbi:MAG: hypothetical protein WA705_12140 [Candidatus Ozemobacteraceae bacterium]
MIVKILIILLIVFFPGLILANDSEWSNALIYWSTEIGNNLDDINQVFYPLQIDPETVQKCIKLKNSSDVRKGPQYSELFRGVNIPENVSIRIDSKNILMTIISNVLNRRTPLINSIMGKVSRFGDRRYFFVCGHTERYGYLEYVQILILEQLIANQDLRFLREAQNLLQYLSDTKLYPVPRDKTQNPDWNKLGYAGCGRGGPAIVGHLKYYMALCHENQK